MSATEKLAYVQAELKRRGAVDAKFYFGATSEKPRSVLKSDVADAMDAYVNGRFKSCELPQDSLRPSI